MKAISLTQPWATLVAIGAKRIETRSWSTTYCGPIAIHAAKSFPDDCRALCLEDPFRKHLKASGIVTLGDLPRGSIIAIGRMQGCRFTEDIVGRLLPDEVAFGDYSPGRFAWFITRVQKLTEPIPYKGALGLWKVRQEVMEQMYRDLAETKVAV